MLLQSVVRGEHSEGNKQGDSLCPRSRRNKMRWRVRPGTDHKGTCRPWHNGRWAIEWFGVGWSQGWACGTRAVCVLQSPLWLQGRSEKEWVTMAVPPRQRNAYMGDMFEGELISVADGVDTEWRREDNSGWCPSFLTKQLGGRWYHLFYSREAASYSC